MGINGKQYGQKGNFPEIHNTKKFSVGRKKKRMLDKLANIFTLFFGLILSHDSGVVLMYSGLDKNLDQWVFHPLLFNLMSILLHI